MELKLATKAGNVKYVPSMGITWKCDRFRELANRANYTDFISIGDGIAERHAVLALRDRCCAKAVRFDSQPCLTLLRDQLIYLTENLVSIARDARTGDVAIFNDGYSIENLSYENTYPVFGKLID